ncbi:MAG: hypothetical protein KDA42_11550 [Planctomycetales bacterium]|nr:hypothetical protein [Planctomycetales bacterium]
MMVTATPSSPWYDEMDDEQEFDSAVSRVSHKPMARREQKSRDKFNTRARHARRSAAKLNNPTGPRRKQRKTGAI